MFNMTWIKISIIASITAFVGGSIYMTYYSIVVKPVNELNDKINMNRTRYVLDLRDMNKTIVVLSDILNDQLKKNDKLINEIKSLKARLKSRNIENVIQREIEEVNYEPHYDKNISNNVIEYSY